MWLKCRRIKSRPASIPLLSLSPEALMNKEEMASHIARSARTLVEQKYSRAHIARKVFLKYVHLLNDRGVQIPNYTMSFKCV